MGKKQTSERAALLSAIKHLDKANEAAFRVTGVDVSLQFHALREVLVEALAPYFVAPADPESEPYNVADDRWDELKQAFQMGGPGSNLSATAARAFAEAAEAAAKDWEERKAAKAA